MQGYDLDDTLAKVNYAQAGVRGLATVFSQADVLYKPSQPFVVITARPHSTQALRDATRKWLEDNQPNFKQIYYVSGSEDEIIRGKARLIKQHNVTSFTDNNSDILSKLKDLLDNVTLYKMYQNGDKKQI